MKNDIHEFVSSYDTFQWHKGKTMKLLCTLKPPTIPNNVPMDMSIDLIMGIPKESNIIMIMVVVDFMTKYSHLCSLPPTFTPPLVE